MASFGVGIKYSMLNHSKQSGKTFLAKIGKKIYWFDLKIEILSNFEYFNENMFSTLAKLGIIFSFGPNFPREAKLLGSKPPKSDAIYAF